MSGNANGTWARAMDDLTQQATTTRSAALQLLSVHISTVLEIARARALAGEGPTAEQQATEIVDATRRDVSAHLDRVEAAIRAGRA